MTRAAYALFLLIALILFLYVAWFPFLAFDAVSKLITRVAMFETGNFMLLIYLELARALTTLVALVAAAVLLVRAARTADGRAMALFLMFAALTYEKVSAGKVYPGPLQQKLTFALLDAGVSRDLLSWLFGTLPWSLWLALAAGLRFSVVFPRALTFEAIDRSGEHDRRGMLRGSAAGLDIGAVLRALTKRALAVGAFEPVPVWIVAIGLAALTGVVGAGLRTLIVLAAGSLVVGLVITNLRGAYAAGAGHDQARIRWVLLGFTLGGALFIIAGLPPLFFDDPVATVPALILLVLAPAAVMICLALSVLYRGSFDTQRALRVLPGYAALTLALVIVFALVATLLAYLTERIGIGKPLSVLAAVLVVVILAPALRQVTLRAVNRVLERPGADILL